MVFLIFSDQQLYVGLQPPRGSKVKRLEVVERADGASLYGAS